MRLFTKSLTITTLISVFFCSSPLYAAPQNLTLLKTDLKTYHDSGNYHKELTEVITKAQEYIAYQAILNKQTKQQKKLALVLDIDETSLSNYHSMIQRDFGGSSKQFHKEIIAANAPAIKATLSLYKEALKHGIKVFFVTGRNESVRNATIENLNKAGYSKWSGLYLKPMDYTLKSIIPFKTQARKTITNQGYTIVASIGDQYSDLKGGYAQQVFKLPNPFYYLP